MKWQHYSFSFQTQLIVSASICADVLEDFGTYSSFVYVFDTGSKPGDGWHLLDILCG